MFQSSFFPIFFSNRRKDDKDNGMVVAEVGLPCGFKADLSKTNANGLDHKETSSDKVVLYFKNVRFVYLLITYHFIAKEIILKRWNDYFQRKTLDVARKWID